MNPRFFLPVLVCLAFLARPSGYAQAGPGEAATLETATEVLTALAAPGRGIPQTMLQDAQAVAIVPGVLKAGLVLGGRHGDGVILVRQPDGSWSNPIFLTLSGGSVGWQVGVQSTDVVLVFKTRNGLERIMRGKSKLTLGADIAVAAGPVGRQAEASTDGTLRAEIYSYSRSRGLFAGVALEGSALLIDDEANEDFYRIRSVRTADILGMRGGPPVVEKLRGELSRLSAPPPPPPVMVVPPPPPPPPTMQPPQIVPPPPPPPVAPRPN